MENSFGTFLKERRLEKNLTQKDLAKELYVSESAVSKWEKDVSRPDITLLPKLSELLGVSEHELITASIDRQARVEKMQAKRWRALSFSWSLFFYIAYGVALVPCFICNLAIQKTLSWFWIVVSALLLSFTFTNLPKLIRKHKLILLPLSMFTALCLLLGVCCIYTGGDWFLIAVVSVLLGLSLIFTPIYIAKCKIFARIKRYNDFISAAVSFVILNILLIVIYANGATKNGWYLKIALPIVVSVYLFLNLLLSVRFLKVNRFLKTSIILALVSSLYVLPILIKVDSLEIQKEIDNANIFKSNFLSWKPELTLENNIHCIICLTMLAIAIIFLFVGLMRYAKTKNKGVR